MSLKTWKKEFYPVSAQESAGSDREALEHSCLKWRGFTKKNLEKHHLVMLSGTLKQRGGKKEFILGTQHCTLCIRHYGNLIRCTGCPLEKSVRCPEGSTNAYDVMLTKGNPHPMLRAMREALKKLKKKQSD